MKKTLLFTLCLSILLSFCFKAAHTQTFGQYYKAVASDRAVDDYFGTSVAISGDYAIVGAPFEDEDAAGTSTLSISGSAYIYERDGSGNWNQVQKLVASDRAADDYFGHSVSISGNYAIVGAYEEDENEFGLNTLSAAGSAYIFERDGGGNWNQVQKIVASDRAADDFFGFSVSISGSYAVVGAYQEDEDAVGTNTLLAAGSAYVFERDGGGVWNEVQKIVSSDRDDFDRYGYAVAISGDRLVVGAHWEDHDEVGANILSSSGSAYIYERDGGGTWNEVQKIVASDRSSSADFGHGVGISGDYLVVGAYDEDYDAAGSNPLNLAGAAYIFERDGGGIWNEAEKLVASDREGGNFFGFNVSISGDKALIGARFQSYDQDGLNFVGGAGGAYVFQRTGVSIWTQIQKVVASDRSSSDQFGYAVAISGDRILVGAFEEDHDEAGMNGLSEAGSAYIFEPCTHTASTLNIAQCDSFTTPSGGATYTVSGTYMDTIPNSSGCDSVMTINLTINTPSTSTINVSSCGSYTVPSGDETYSASGTYPDTIPNMAGCDSILTINLTINGSTSWAIAESSCDSYTVPSGDETYTSSGTYTDTIPNTAGCDSVLTIILTITNSSAATINETACSGYTVPSGDETHTTSGTYMDTIPNMAGCDSVITINLTINGSTTSTINESTCISYTVPSGDETYTSSGTYTDTIPNSIGCDSVITINLTINTVNISTVLVDPVITAIASGANYQWLDCDNSFAIIPGETNQSFTAAMNGNFAVEITENGCTDTSACESVLSIDIGESPVSEIRVYPNPTRGKVFVNGAFAGEEITVSTLDLSGKLIGQEHFSPDQAVELDLDYPQGTYFLKIESEQIITVVSIIKL